MSVAGLPDPRVWPALEGDACNATPGSTLQRAAALHRVVTQALESATSRDEALRDAEATRAIRALLAEGGEALDKAFAFAPSVAVARHLSRLLANIERGTPEQNESLRTVLFAIPIVLVTALDAGAPSLTLSGVLSQAPALEALLRDANEFGGAQTFTLSSALVGMETIDIGALPALLARSRLHDADDPGAGLMAVIDVEPSPIVVDSRAERVHLRFAVGAVLATPRTDPFATSVIARWGMPFAQLLVRDLTVPGVSLLALPRFVERLVRAAQSGRTAHREVAAQLFASNAIRKFRATVGEPHAVISAHRCIDAPGQRELRLSLSSPFAAREAEGFRCPIYPYETVHDAASMLVTLLRDCRIERIDVREGIHADVDSITGGRLFFKEAATAPPLH